MTRSSPLQVSELPPRISSGVQYQVLVRTEHEEGVYQLPEGTISVGQADRCDIQIRAAGVQPRHMVLKRSGDHVVGRALGRGTDAEVRSVALEEPFRVGAATVRVRRVDPEDHAAAVELALRDHPDDVPPVPVRTRLGDMVGQVDDEAARQIQRLTDALGTALPAGRLRPGVLLDALGDCMAPRAAALFWQPTAEPDGRWACMGVHGSATPPPPPEASHDWLCVRQDISAGTWALVLRPSGAATAAWQQALCRHVVGLGAWGHAAPAEGTCPDAQSPVRPPDGDVWARFVGEQLRSHLQQFTDLCTYARSVLVIGETGTGKELASQALHHQVWQCEGPLVALNCAAVPDELLEAELFGVEEGAATGVRARAGRFGQARGGTLFLDEVAEMPTALQSKLLRVLQERTYVRLGGSELLDADVRIVAATNRPEATLRDGTHMRPDLYFRLAQATVPLPPLRERPADVPALCEYFLGELETRFGRGVCGISVSTLRALQDYPWPGNVRELKNVLRGVYAHTPPGTLATPHHLPDVVRSADETPAPVPNRTASAEAAPPGNESDDVPEAPPGPVAPTFGPAYDSLDAFLTAVERETIARVLADHDRVADAADRLDLSPSYLYRKIKAHDLSP